MYLGCKINLKYSYNDVWELGIGILVTTIIMNILDCIFCEIAYRITGLFSKNLGYDSSDRRVVHWVIRVILYTVVYIISLTPLCGVILTPVVQYFTVKIIQWYDKSIEYISNALL